MIFVHNVVDFLFNVWILIIIKYAQNFNIFYKKHGLWISLKRFDFIMDIYILRVITDKPIIYFSMNFIMKNPLISVLICTYNAEKTIEKTLKSCISQTYKNFEILIHDDQSADKTLEIINKLWDKRIKIIKSWKKLWPYKWLNLLLDYAKWKYIAIQDHDDLRYPEKLEKQVIFLEKNKNYIGCWTKTLMWYEWDNKWFEYYLWKENYYTIHPSLMFRNKWYRYAENIVYMWDAYFQKKILCKGKKIIGNIDEVLTIHRIKKITENYSYKWFNFNKKNVKTIFYIHSVLYWIMVVWFELIRKTVYPILYRFNKSEWIYKIERRPFIMQRMPIISTIGNRIIYGNY